MKKLIIGNRLLSFCLILICNCIHLLTYAGTQEELEKMMDEIKLDASYLYGESFNDNADVAYGNSLTDLIIYCNELRCYEGLGQLKSSDLQPIVKEIKSLKNGQYTVFLYIKLEDMLKIHSKSHVDITEINPQSFNQSQQKNAQSDFTQFNENQSQSQKPVEAPGNNEKVQSSFQQDNPFSSSDVLATLTIQNTWTELKPMIKHYKEIGKITKTGNTQQWISVPDDAYAILFDADAGVLAFFSPQNNSERLNYKTNRVDNATNYSNCKFIVWYK